MRGDSLIVAAVKELQAANVRKLLSEGPPEEADGRPMSAQQMAAFLSDQLCWRELCALEDAAEAVISVSFVGNAFEFRQAINVLSEAWKKLALRRNAAKQESSFSMFAQGLDGPIPGTAPERLTGTVNSVSPDLEKEKGGGS